LFSSFCKLGTEFVVAFRATSETNDGHRRWQFSIGDKIVERWNQFPVGQVTGGSEDDNCARLRHRARA